MDQREERKIADHQSISASGMKLMNKGFGVMK
jgi:hypothetical protein